MALFFMYSFKYYIINNKMNISGSGQLFTYSQEYGSLTLTGSNNTVNLKGCQASIWINGQGNILNVIQCQLEVHFNGNDNLLRVERSQLNVGMNGDKNKVQTSLESEAFEDSCKMAVLYNNGFQNQIPPNIKLTNSDNTFTSKDKRSNSLHNNQLSSSRQSNQLNNFSRSSYIPQPQSSLFQYSSYQPSFMYNQMPNSNNFSFSSINSSFQNLFSRSHSGNQRLYNGYRFQNHYRDDQPYRYAMLNDNVRKIPEPRNSYLNNRRMQQSRQQCPNGQNRIPSSLIAMSTDDDDNNSNGDIQVPYFGQPRISRPRTIFTFDHNFPEINQSSQQLCLGLTKKQVNRLSVCKFEGESSKCSICLQDIQKNNDVLFLFCFHSFHSNCGLSWLQKSVTCPICHTDVRAELEKSK